MEKNPQYQARTNNKLNPLKAPGLNLNLAHLGRRQVLSALPPPPTAPSLLQEPRPKIVCLFSLQISFRTCYLSINVSESLLVVRMRSFTLLMLISVMCAIILQMKQVRSAVHLTRSTDLNVLCTQKPCRQPLPRLSYIFRIQQMITGVYALLY